jgi:CHAT domain-containing protein/DNA-binding SARP family transcriptional activator
VEGRSLAKPVGADVPQPATASEPALAEATRVEQQVIQLYQQGQVAEAIPLAQQVLEVRERILGNDHSEVAVALSTLGLLYQAQVDYAAAEPLFQRSLSIYEAVLGLDHPYVAISLSNLAGVYYVQGRYVEAEPLYQRVLTIQEQTSDIDPLNVATTLINLLACHQAQNNYAEAESYLQRVLTIERETQTFAVLDHLHRLGNVYLEQGNYSAVEWLFHHIVTNQAQELGSNHLGLALSLNALAALYVNQDNYTEAELLLHRALTISEQAPEVENFNHLRHIVRKETLGHLLTLYTLQGDYAAAEAHLRQSAILDAQYYDSSIDISAAEMPQLFLPALDWTEANIDSALTSLEWINQITEEFLTSMVGSELRQQGLMQMYWRLVSIPITFHLQAASNNPNAAQFALTTVLQRKGRILDTLTDNLQLLRQQLAPTHQALLDQLVQIRTQQANLSYDQLPNLPPQQYQLRFEQLDSLANQLEAELSRLSARFRSEFQPVTLATVQQHIPVDAALVELVKYQRFNPEAINSETRWGTWHYAAYILHQTGSPQAVDLGEAEVIDAQIETFRQVLQFTSRSVQPAARQLDELVMQPIRAKLNGATHVLISPDGQLNLIPFAALVNENDRYLLEDYTFTYLTSGRDLLKLQNDTPSRTEPVLFANPDYAQPGNAEVSQAAVGRSPTRGTAARSADIATFVFEPLEGTQTEVEAIAPLLPNATVLTGTEATEATLKQLQAPSILHLATHGFFLQDVEFVPPGDVRGTGTIISVPTGEAFVRSSRPRSNENPLLRSGLALAGFNSRQGGNGEDGVLTALEVTGLNLQGTRLVVMSACETGVGDVANGEGVYGLRRAFVMAGAESQMMSLWKVDDYGTSELMSLYYERLSRGENRSEALRQVQLEFLEAPAYRHPFYWAAFIFSGDWSSMAAL